MAIFNSYVKLPEGITEFLNTSAEFFTKSKHANYFIKGRDP
jgi:hypothetical protein